MGRESRTVAPPTPLPAAFPELVRLFEEGAENPALDGATVGACVLDEQGRTLFEHQGHVAFIPASTLKTVTSATALETWGPNFRLETRLIATAPIVDGRMDGDLVIVGGADPMLSLDDFKAWVRTLMDQGLRHITGRIIGDGRLLSGSLYGDFWNWGDIGNGYGSGVSGLNLEHNRYTARFRPGAAEGTPALFLGSLPEVPDIRWQNHVTTGAPGSGDGVVIHGGESTPVIHLRGTVPAGQPVFEVTGAVPDPELYAAYHLKALLIQAGMQVDGETASSRSTSVPEAEHLLLTHASPPLLEIIRSLHVSSDNLETECLYRLLGTQTGRPPQEVVRSHWRSRGLDFKGLRMEDGCGLARADFIRPVDLARLQWLAVTGPQGSDYETSLLSSDDGALRWKGGAMSGVRCWTGMVRRSDGGACFFALMMNHFSDASATLPLRDRFLACLREAPNLPKGP